MTQLWQGLVFNPMSIRLLREGCADLKLKLFVPTEVVSRRGISHERPLLPYAFVAGATDRGALLRIRGVLRYLRTPHRDYACATEEQIVAMQDACGLLKRSQRTGLRPGDRVRLRQLALGALEATVMEVQGRRARIATPMLGKVHEQWIDAEQLETVQ